MASTSSIPTTQKAILVHETGNADVLTYTEDYAVPTLSDGQVLVKNHFAGVNYIDTYFRVGMYPAPGGLPLVIGQEASGVIAKIQGDSAKGLGLKEGDRVVWMAGRGYAEYSAVPADRVVKIPDGISDEHAVGGFLMGMTALSLIKEAYPVKKGETVLVHAAAGGMGLLLCQLLRDLGATVIGTAGGPEKTKLAKENGATHVIDYKATSGPSWVEQVMKLTDGKGVDVTYDGVGKDTWEGSLEVAKRKSKVVYYGAGMSFISHFPNPRVPCRISPPHSVPLTLTLTLTIYHSIRAHPTLQHRAPVGQERLHHALHPDAVHCHARGARVLRQRRPRPDQGR